MEEKMKYFTTELEGYGNDKIAFEGQILDWMDRLYLQVEPENERKMRLWPEGPTSFKYGLDCFLIDVIYNLCFGLNLYACTGRL